MKQTITIKEAADIYRANFKVAHVWPPFFVRNEPPGSDDPGGSGLDLICYTLYRGR